MSLEPTNTLIDVHELRRLIESQIRLTVLDVCWAVDRPDSRAEYLRGHIPGAAFVDLDADLASPPRDGARHPLPSRDALQHSARLWGVRDGDVVVVYDDATSMSAARAWWLLRDAGVDDVRVLDGGLSAWNRAEMNSESGWFRPSVGNVTLGTSHQMTVDCIGVRGLPVGSVLIDARAVERFRGEVEPIDSRAGHIPGARCVPAAGNVSTEGNFLPVIELAQRFEEIGVLRGAFIVNYCGSGITASHNVLALHLAGFESALYPGSWSEWSSTPEMPVETGDR